VPVLLRAQRVRRAGRARRDRPGERDRRARLPEVRPPVAFGLGPSGRGSERAGEVSGSHRFFRSPPPPPPPTPRQVDHVVTV